MYEKTSTYHNITYQCGNVSEGVKPINVPKWSKVSHISISVNEFPFPIPYRSLSLMSARDLQSLCRLHVSFFSEINVFTGTTQWSNSMTTDTLFRKDLSAISLYRVAQAERVTGLCRLHSSVLLTISLS